MDDKSDKYIIRGPPALPILSERSVGQQIHDSLKQNQHLGTGLIDAFTGQTLTYGAVFETTCRLARALQNFGIEQNDVVGVFSENNLEFCFPVVASMYLGTIVTTLNSQYTPHELLHVINISKPKIIFCSIITVDVVLKIKQHLTFVKAIIVINSLAKRDDFELLEEFIHKNNGGKKFNIHEFKPLPVKLDSVAFILYSSGTTGLPKGVMLTHKNYQFFIGILSAPQYHEQFKPGSRTSLGLLPFVHAYGLTVICHSLKFGIKVIVMKNFDPVIFLESIQNYKITTLYIVPPLANYLAKSPLVDNYDMSSVTIISCGAAPLSKHTRKLLTSRIKAQYKEGYGLTEATLGITYFPLDKYREGSVGKILPSMSAKVVDVETGNSLGPMQSGELCFKGDMIMKGYAGDVEATRNAFDKNGWLRTGDVGYYDQDGYLYIVDRVKELIKYKGFQVPPAELEGVLLAHPKILDAAVVGLPNEKVGELAVAFVVKESNQDLTEQDVINYIAERLSPQKHLHGGVKFVSEIPKTSTGKILRRKLREQLLNLKSRL